MKKKTIGAGNTPQFDPATPPQVVRAPLPVNKLPFQGIDHSNNIRGQGAKRLYGDCPKKMEAQRRVGLLCTAIELFAEGLAPVGGRV